MVHPPYSYLDPATIDMALDMARELSQASETVARLTRGAGPGSPGLTGGGRVGAKVEAVRDWIGPHRDTFEQLFDNEMASASTAVSRLAEEADDWARFWAIAMNARNDRLYDEAYAAFSSGMDTYRSRAESYRYAVENDPSLAAHLSAPTPPTAPARPLPVPAPTAASDYRP